MSRTHQRWAFILVLIFGVVLAACQPAATPTPTPRPTATTAPPPTTEPTIAAPATQATVETTAAVLPTQEASAAATTEAAATAVLSPTAETTSAILAPTEEMTLEATSETTPELGDIISVAQADGHFTMLLSALDKAGLTDTLKGAGPFTVFAPTDSAFVDLVVSTNTTSAQFLNRSDLAAILKYHVVSGKVTADQLETYRSTDNPDLIVVPTLDDNKKLNITFAADGTIVINGTTKVTLKNVMASNGVIHVIDTVLMPQTAQATAEATAAVSILPATVEVTMAATEMAMSTPEATMAPSASTTAAGSSVTVAPGDSVVIGLAAGLSGAGIAPLGIDIQRGAELALKDRPNVTVDGKSFPVKLDAQDDQCSPDGGQAVANRYASESTIVGVVGPMCSSACLAAAPIFDAAGYTTISPSCTGALLSTSGFTSFNRAAVSDVFQGRIAASFIYNVLKARKIATIHDGSAYGEGLVNVVAAEFEKLGGKVVSSDAVTVGDTDFRGLLDDVAQNSPDLIYFGGFPAEAARLIQQRADAGLDKVNFMSADGVYGTEVINLAGASSEGAYATSGIPASAGGGALTKFLSEYVAAYGEQPPAPYHTNAYDATNIFLDAIEAVGKVDASGNLVINRAALANYVRTIKSFQGLTGTLTNDGTGEMFTFGEFGVFQVKNGVFTQIYTGTVANGEVTLTPYTAPATEEATVEATTEAATAEATASS